jgi:hypothetical protein
MDSSQNKSTVFAQIKELKKAKDWDQMLVVTKQALKDFPGESKILNWLHYAQAHYVDQKLHSDVVKQLEEKQDYSTLYNVYLKLLGVFPESRQLKKLLKKVKSKIDQAHVDERQAYFDQAEATIKQFMGKQEYDKARNACYEIMSYDPENEHFMRLSARIERRFDRKLNTEMDAFYKEELPRLKDEYKADKIKFIKL